MNAFSKYFLSFETIFNQVKLESNWELRSRRWDPWCFSIQYVFSDMLFKQHATVFSVQLYIIHHWMIRTSLLITILQICSMCLFFFLSLTRHPFYYIKMQWFKTGTCMLRIILSNGDEQTLFLRVEIATWYSQFSNFPRLL